MSISLHAFFDELEKIGGMSRAELMGHLAKMRRRTPTPTPGITSLPTRSAPAGMVAPQAQRHAQTDSLKAIARARARATGSAPTQMPVAAPPKPRMSAANIRGTKVASRLL